MSTLTEAQINERTQFIINKNAQNSGLHPDDFTEAQRQDARNFAIEQLEYENDPKVQALQAANEEIRQLRAQNEALKSRGPASAPAGRAPFVAEQVRGRIGNATWFTLSYDAKIRAAGEDPSNVNLTELRKLFGRGADTAKALDYSKQNPTDYAKKRELAKLLDLYGA